jgi:hypothetical protein
MAELALKLKVFIASPSDVRPERDAAESELIELQKEYAGKRLLLDVYRWERSVTPGWRRVQTGINKHLREAELVIGILWSTLGTRSATGETGTEEELRIAAQLADRGFADDVFLYFKDQAVPTGTTDTAVQGVVAFRTRVCSEMRAFTGTFTTLDDFRHRLRQDLRNWIDRWVRVAEICAFALRRAPGGALPSHVVGEGRLSLLKQQLDPLPHLDQWRPLAAAAMWSYQEHGSAGSDLPIQIEDGGSGWRTGWRRLPSAFEPLLAADVARIAEGGLRFTNPEWFYFFCAAGLVDALMEGDQRPVRRRRYLNPIHQYLRALAVEPTRARIIPVLRQWLLNGDGSTDGQPIARDFAAYVLGMIGATEADEDLAHVIAHDSDAAVRAYCVASLGRMRARAQLPLLVDLYESTDKDEMRETVAQAVTRMVGVADYAL